jgi:hypothetical protein
VSRRAAAYLLVYLAGGGEPDPWADLGQDPDLGHAPMTWGICRTNVRNWAREGDDLFFIAKAPGEPGRGSYFLSAAFRVAERIGHAQARRRFGTRPNVIVDELPPGADLRARVAGYVDRWSAQLQWNDGRPDRTRLVSGDRSTDEFTVSLDGSVYVHSYWDCHPDWQRRLTAPYLVADPEVGGRLTEPIPWSVVTEDASRALPTEARLTNRSHRHAAQRVWDPDDHALLRNLT